MKVQTVIYTIEPREFNDKLAEALKKITEFEAPEWSYFVKSSVARLRPPYNEDFWHKRAASILRQLYIRKNVGVNRLKARYGGKKNRGAKPSEQRDGSGKIIRVILQQAEKAGLVEKGKGKKAGRKLTEKGKQLLEGMK
ncbi:40S ribosomal protein S19 [Candidatus Pacearchaeota archaeon]|nr:40S ribosomal protein S19 [Candidatus Pacearchaeota archaeon]